MFDTDFAAMDVVSSRTWSRNSMCGCCLRLNGASISDNHLLFCTLVRPATERTRTPVPANLERTSALPPTLFTSPWHSNYQVYAARFSQSMTHNLQPWGAGASRRAPTVTRIAVKPFPRSDGFARRIVARMARRGVVCGASLTPFLPSHEQTMSLTRPRLRQPVEWTRYLFFAQSGCASCPPSVKRRRLVARTTS